MPLTLREIKKLPGNPNISNKLSTSELTNIGKEAVRLYNQDRNDAGEWIEELDQIIELTKLMSNGEVKDFPWIGASNVKVPLITKACLKFAASVYAEIIKSGKVAKGKVIGKDPDQSKKARSDRVSDFINFQLTEDIPEWEEDTDKLLSQLPMVGCYFKKTYYSPLKRRNMSQLIAPTSLIISKYCGDFEYTPRMTHLISMTYNEIEERKRLKIFNDVDLRKSKDDAYREVLEQHCFIDLDDDGYEEPYIVTVDKDTNQVLRIVARFNTTDVLTTIKGDEIVSIRPINFFTKYRFLQPFDDSPYGMGFGKLLLDLNKTINTTTNQLLDAGTDANTTRGFIDSSLDLGGDDDMNLGPNEWKRIHTGGDSIANKIFPLQSNGPSEVLMKLLEFLISIGEDLTASRNILSGEIPVNTPATTVLASISESYKIYSSVFKRIYNALNEELKKIYFFTQQNPDNFAEKYETVLDDEAANFDTDFSYSEYDIVPIANPEASSDTLNLIKSQALVMLLDSPSAQSAGLNARGIYKKYLEALKIDDVDVLLPEPDPNAPPSLDQQMLELQKEALANKTQLETMKLTQKESELNIKTAEISTKIENIIADTMKKISEAEKLEVETHLGMGEAEHTASKIYLQENVDQLKNIMKELGLDTNDETNKTEQGRPY